jgi:5,10-methylenetetrahydromethanopterin reductase
VSGLRFGLRLPPCAPATEVADFARRAELAGFDAVWIPDSQFLWRDVWATAALVADRTERVGIGTAVTNFETRHVAVTASAVASLAELAPGRLRVAVGTGDSAVKTLGLRPTRLRRMREQIALLRRLAAGEEASWEGHGRRYGGRPMRIRHAREGELPVLMAASGPRALALAGEVADGVIIHSGLAPGLIERSLDIVRRGAEAGGRRLEDLDLWIGAHTAVTEDADSAARLVKPLCLSSAQLGAGGALGALGIELEVPPVVEGVYPDVTHAENWELAMEIAERYVDDEAARRYAEAFTLAGTVEQIGERIETAAGLGVGSFYVLGLSSYELPVAALDAFAATLLPRFGGAAGGALANGPARPQS